jgi:hypothetical protein
MVGGDLTRPAVDALGGSLGRVFARFAFPALGGSLGRVFARFAFPALGGVAFISVPPRVAVGALGGACRRGVPARSAVAAVRRACFRVLPRTAWHARGGASRLGVPARFAVAALRRGEPTAHCAVARSWLLRIHSLRTLVRKQCEGKHQPPPHRIRTPCAAFSGLRVPVGSCTITPKLRVAYRARARVSLHSGPACMQCELRVYT